MFSIENKSVSFSWTTKEIIENIINQCAMHAASTDSLQFEQCVLTEENSEFFNLEIKNAMSDLVILFIKSANIVDGSIDVLSDKSGESKSGLAIKQISDSGGNMVVNPSRLTIIDLKCKQYITDSILLQWAKIYNIKPFIEKFSYSQFNSLNEIKNNLFHMRVLSYGQSYTLTSTT